MSTDLQQPTSLSLEGDRSLHSHIDSDALDVVTRLSREGFEAYLVGGCVRDLLLGREPKDFDVATSAHPSEIRMLFRNCRLIGRRFRLAHLHYRGGKIIETATFRANPFEEMDEPPEDLLLSRDNVFGTAEQDARRRDFTVNGLFFDATRSQVIDFVDGLPDLDSRVLRFIGDPTVRVQEDPVRILRAARLAGKLGFDISQPCIDAMRTHATALSRCAPARLTDEISRLVHCGAARAAVDWAFELGAMDALLPEISAELPSGSPQRLLLQQILNGYDQAQARGFQANHAVAMAMLFLPATLNRDRDERQAWLEHSLDRLGERLKNPKRDRDRIRQLIGLYIELGTLEPDDRRVRTLVRRNAFAESLVLRTLALQGQGGDLTEVGHWKALARHHGVELRALPGAPRPGAGRRRGRRGGQRNGARRRGGQNA